MIGLKYDIERQTPHLYPYQVSPSKDSLALFLTYLALLEYLYHNLLRADMVSLIMEISNCLPHRRRFRSTVGLSPTETGNTRKKNKKVKSIFY